MTFTVEKIEQARRHVEIVIRSSHLPGWKENREAWDLLNATFLDYAAMKRREAESVPVLHANPNDLQGYTLGHYAHVRAGDKSSNFTQPLYTSPPSQPWTGVPDGWQLVPIKPTDKMTYEGQKVRYPPYNSITVIYQAMLAAAPRSP